jgi:hypothetical protein
LGDNGERKKKLVCIEKMLKAQTVQGKTTKERVMWEICAGSKSPQPCDLGV